MLDGNARCPRRWKNDPLSLQAGVRLSDSCRNITASWRVLLLLFADDEGGGAVGHCPAKFTSEAHVCIEACGGVDRRACSEGVLSQPPPVLIPTLDEGASARIPLICRA